jgi:CheY-like chemotaxis protein
MVTARQQPGEQVVLSNEEFLAMLAHELRNPLAPIMNALHVLERNASNQLVKNSTEILSRQVGHIVGVINDLLDIAKIVKKEMQLQTTDVELCTLVREATESCKTVLNSRRHLLKVTLPNKGDKARLQEIVVHLINNAAKFTETGGKISVTMNHGEDTAMINIKDTGVGIPADALNEIFHLFNQPDHTRHMAQGGGLGVGLTLARELAFLHNGTIEVTSEGLGKGSEFSLILPVSKITDEIPKEIQKTPINVFSRCLEILVVDDHIDTAESLAVLLKMWGHTVHIAHSGTAALTAAKIHGPEIAILDIGLPGADGYQVASKLKEDFPKISLIAITGYGQKVDRRRSDHAGFTYHLIKPVIASKLQEALASFMTEPELISK